MHVSAQTRYLFAWVQKLFYNIVNYNLIFIGNGKLYRMHVDASQC